MQDYAGLSAKLIWDGTDEVRIPSEMGTPKEGQMVGTAGERLTELAGRVCYDSLGSGRPSGEYIQNILSVNHLSIAEHYTATARLRGEMSPDLLISLLNRPWTWVNFDDKQTIRITTNIRGVREWDAHSEKCAKESPLYPIVTAKTVGLVLRDLFHPLAPRIIEKPVHDQVWPMMRGLRITESAIVPPEHNSERWVTVYMVGSRGFSHELVRHGDWTAISQRSTRYCEESESPWVLHPLVQEFLFNGQLAYDSRIDHLIDTSRQLYRDLVNELVTFVTPRLKDDPYAKTSARKQARGAARGFLGNALETEIIFSASVSQLLHILRMRAANAADAEIRVMACMLLGALKSSRYASEFSHLTLSGASDDLGQCLQDGGAK